MTTDRRELMPGVYLTAMRTRKFKTSMLSLSLMLPLREKTASQNAILPMVLHRGTARYPDMQQFSAALDQLYGAEVVTAVRKRGEVQCVGFQSVVIEDRYALGEEALMEEISMLLGDLLLRPATKNGRFYSAYVDGERENLLRRIRAKKNDKRAYARLRLIQEMCRKEAYGVDGLGSEAAASEITGPKLFAHYNKVLSGAKIELIYCGQAPYERVAQAIVAGLQGLPRDREQMVADTELVRQPPDGSPRTVMEELDVSQGRLALGYRTGTALWEESFPALMVLNAALGGTVTSKLFSNVRERLSLCYDIGSTLEKGKGLMVISAGIAPEAYDMAMEEILSQVDAAKRGDFSELELQSARQMLVSALRGTMDSQGRLEDFYLGQIASSCIFGPEELADAIEQVTLEQVVAVAQAVRLDTVYFLKGKGDVQ